MSLTSYRAALSRVVVVVHEIYSAREIVLFFHFPPCWSGVNNVEAALGINDGPIHANLMRNRCLRQAIATQNNDARTSG